MKRIVTLLSAAVVAHAAAQGPSLIKRWASKPVLRSPESVLFSAQDQVLYVSNMGPGKDPNAKDGDGSVGKIALDGEVVAAEWIRGLHAPKGLAWREGRLFVADIDRIVVIDIARGEIAHVIPIEGAKSLNDLTIDSAGTLYVSDYQAGKILAIKEGKSSVFLDGLKNPNGILAHGDDLYFLSRSAVYRAQAEGSAKPIVTGLDAGVDGIEHLSGNDFVVSCYPGIIYRVNVAEGSKRTLIDQREAGIQSADIGIDAKAGILYVPTLFTHQVLAYDLK